MKSGRFSGTHGWERAGAGAVFLAVGALIILVFSPWRPLLESKAADYLGRILLITLLLAAAGFSRAPRWVKYRPLLLGLLILAVAVSLDLVFSRYLLNTLKVSDAVPSGWAIVKLNEALVVWGVIILLTRATGAGPGSLYLQKGNLRLGLLIGGGAFLLAAAGSVPMAALFKARDLSLDRIAAWAPWLLLYVLANGALEELMFRGLFLRKLQPFFTDFWSNFLVAVLFTGLHGSVTYSADNLMFLAVTFPLALAWGTIMQKTNSLWGSLLFHAGMDLPVMLGIFSNL